MSSVTTIVCANSVTQQVMSAGQAIGVMTNAADTSAHTVLHVCVCQEGVPDMGMFVRRVCLTRGCRQEGVPDGRLSSGGGA